ncbi:hypothetical protein BGW39_001252, partial [Mortierella sp. 14UC]
QAAKKLLRPTVQAEDRTVSNALAAVPFGSVAMAAPHVHQDNGASASVKSSNNGLSTLTSISSHASPTPVASAAKAALSISPPVASQLWLPIFHQNVSAPSPLVSLPPAGARLETTVQLAYCNHLLRIQLSPSSAAASTTTSLDRAQQASIDAILQNTEEQSQIHWLTTRVVEEFAADSFKTSEKIAEVILLGPHLNQEYHRKLLNCLIDEFESAKLLDINLLQGMVQLVQCAGPGYLVPDDLVRILVVLRNRFQDTHQQLTEHPYYLTLALSRLLDVMVEGKVQDLRRVVDQEPLLTLLGRLSSSEDPYLKHQAAYAMQALLHIPNDESRRQFMMRQAGRITMGLLGVASVCKLDLGELKAGVDHLYKATGDIHEVTTKIVGGAQSLVESGQDIARSVKGGILSGGRQIWYSALREAQEHVRNGRLADFNGLVFEAPCRRDVEFQWGVCQLLGEIAVDAHWNIATRQNAIDLLAELYKDESIWTAKKDVHNWILQIVRQVASFPNSAISDHAQSVLQGLNNEGDAAKHALYHDVLDTPVNSYPLQVLLPTPMSSMLLARVQAVPDVEYDLHRLKVQRLKEQENTLYIPPQAKPTLQASNDALFPLMEKALEFVAGSRQVLLLLGDSGGGKSTFNLQFERGLWQDYQRGGAIPLYINLPAIDNPQQNMIAKQLQQLNFSDAQIQELKQHRQFILICDGYDESQQKRNLYTTNGFNQPGQWRVKMVVSCRSQYLGPDYRSRFQPTVDRYSQATPDLFQEAVLAPFSRAQIEQYVGQYVHQVLPQLTSPCQLAWDVKDFMDKLVKIPRLIELVSNPFLLTLALRSLPRVVRSEQDLSMVRLTRVGLYDSFIVDWLETNKQRLEESVLSSEAQSIFDVLLDEGFVLLGISYQKDLSAAIFQHQGGNPVVEYYHLRERHTWKASFFSPDLHTTILREVSPLTRAGNQFRFLHRSMLEYLYSRVMSDPFEGAQHTAESGSVNEELSESFVNHPLNQRSIVEEPSILQFLAERVELDPMFEARLLSAIEASKTDATVSTAAANAISILVKAGARFNGADLRGIRISGADVCGGEFDSADMEGADLSNVNLSKAWLRKANLCKTHLTGVQFGELPYIACDNAVACVVISSDEEFLAVSLFESTILIYETTTWNRVASYPGGEAIAASPVSPELAKAAEDDTVEVGDILTGEPRLVLRGHDDKITRICYSSDGNKIATASKDITIRIWSTVDGESLHILELHIEPVTGVAFSPDGLRLVSCGEDSLVLIWDALTGEPLVKLEGHNEVIVGVAYSPDGCQIAGFGDQRGTWFWDAHTHEMVRVFNGLRGSTHSIAYSPDGNHIAFGATDGSICLYDSHNGDLLGTLSGHLYWTISVTYSPTCDYIASGSLDRCVRLWKTGEALSNAFPGDERDDWVSIAISTNGEQSATGGRNGGVQLWETLTGKPGAVLKGHTARVNMLAFSPCGKRIATSSRDGTVRQWCVQTGAVIHVLDNLAENFLRIAYSPCGNHIIATSEKKTFRIWNAQTGELNLILEGHTDCITNMAYSPSGHQIATCSEDETVRLWDANTGEQLFVLENPKGALQAIYSPDGQQLISISIVDSWLRIWDPQSGEIIGRTDLAGLGILCCCYSPNGKFIATVNGDGCLRLWDLSSGGFVSVFRSKVGSITALQWRQSSEHMYLTTEGLGFIRVWRLVEEEGGTFDLRMVRSLGEKELSLANAKLCGDIGLSPVDLKLVKQRGAIIDS